MSLFASDREASVFYISLPLWIDPVIMHASSYKWKFTPRHKKNDSQTKWIWGFRPSGLYLYWLFYFNFQDFKAFKQFILDNIFYFYDSNCPDECKEAVQSLMHAAARFADLPELRELRTLFTEKFGDSLEPYISKEVWNNDSTFTDFSTLLKKKAYSFGGYIALYHSVE